jgi:hypothetical protein
MKALQELSGDEYRQDIVTGDFMAYIVAGIVALFASCSDNCSNRMI